jgi:hypothetical protein
MHPVIDGILGGWQVNGIFAYSSGRPRTISSGRDQLIYQGSSTADCNNAACNPEVTGQVIKGDTIRGFTKAEADYFSIPLSGSAGGSAEYGFRNSPKWLLDASVFKEFPLRFIPGEEGRLQFRFEFFNSLNHTNFGNPSSTVTSGSFGNITSSDSARILQVALKLYF